MNKWSVLLMVFLGTTATAEELAVAEIVRRIDATERLAASEGLVEQTIITSGGKKRTLKAKTYSRDRND